MQLTTVLFRNSEIFSFNVKKIQIVLNAHFFFYSYITKSKARNAKSMETVPRDAKNSLYCYALRLLTRL